MVQLPKPQVRPSGCALPGHDIDIRHAARTANFAGWRWSQWKCKKCHNERQRAYAATKRRKLREEANAHYGPGCRCCGEQALVFLAIDHVEGGGREHHRVEGINGSGLALWCRKNGWPGGFQMLCHNCNFAKHVLGSCPHGRLA